MFAKNKKLDKFIIGLLKDKLSIKVEREGDYICFKASFADTIIAEDKISIK